MMPILGFIKGFANRQKLGLRAWEGACVCLFLSNAQNNGPFRAVSKRCRCAEQ